MIKGLIVVGIGLLVIALFSSSVNMINGSRNEAELGSFEFGIRTGGRLQEPRLENHGYPLGHSIYSPGNLTMNTIEEFREFSIFYQMFLGIEILENGSEIDSPVPVNLGAQYDIYLNLTSYIQVKRPEGLITRILVRLMNFHLNASTSQRVILILTRETSISIIDSGTAVEIIYFETETVNENDKPTSEILGSPRSFQVSIADTMNVSLISEWTALFVSPDIDTRLFSGEGIVGFFQIERNINSDFQLAGFFRCYYRSENVNVQSSWLPVFEFSAAIAGIIAISLAMALWNKSNDRKRARMVER